MLLPLMPKVAVINGCYRYLLWRIWDSNLPQVTFVMGNPSSADGESDDPTLRRCISFAHAWGFGSVSVVNAFACLVPLLKLA